MTYKRQTGAVPSIVAHILLHTFCCTYSKTGKSWMIATFLLTNDAVAARITEVEQPQDMLSPQITNYSFVHMIADMYSADVGLHILHHC